MDMAMPADGPDMRRSGTRARPAPAKARPGCDAPPQPAERQLPALPTLRQLQYLVALARYRSFSRAALACCVTQSTLSGAIKELEATLGLRLVDRDRRRVIITAAGAEVVARAGRILSEAEALTGWARRGTGPLSGSLRLGVIPTIAPFLLPRLLPQLKAAFPGLVLKLREDTTATLLDSLKAGELDLVMMAFPYDVPGLETAIVGDDPLLFAEPGRRPDGASATEIGETAEIAEIAGRPLLLLQDGHCLRDHALSACALPAARIDEFGATSLFTLTRLVEADHGVTLLPKMAVDAGLCDTARLTVRPLKAPTPTRRIGLAWRRNAGCAADCQAMADFLHGSGLFA